MTAQPMATGSQQPDPLRWKALAVVLIASFMILLDISIVNVAIPSVQRTLGASYAEIQWVLAGYQLAYAVVLITGGRLGDIFGRKRLFIIGVSGFTIASAICGLSQTPTELIGARVFQGLMAALMYPQVLSVIQVVFPPRERGTAFGIFGGVIGVATISGPLLGGLLIQADIHIGGTALLWRPIFLVNLPIGIGAVIAAFVYLHESVAPTRPRLDPVGVVLATTALFLIAFPLVEGRDAGWPLWAYLMIAIGLVLLVLFGRYVVSRTRSGRSALVEPVLFGDRAFVAGAAISMAFFAGIPAFFLTFSLYMQVGLGFSALHAGLTTAPYSILSAVASGMSIRLAPKLGKWILSVGAFIEVLAMVALWLTVHLAGTGITSYDLIPALALGGIGLGLVVAPLVTIILSGIQSHAAGSASGVLTTVQQVGGALGVAIVGIIFFGAVTNNATPAAQSGASSLTTKLVAAGVPQQQAAGVSAVFARCLQEQAASSDPSSTPAGCPSAPTSAPTCVAPGAGQIPCITYSVAQTSLATDFDASFRSALFYEMVAFGLVLVLVFALPRGSAAQGPPGAGGGGPAGGH